MTEPAATPLRCVVCGSGDAVTVWSVARTPMHAVRPSGVADHAGGFGQIGEAVALQHGRQAVDLAVIANEVEPRLARRKELLNIRIFAPVRNACSVDGVY